MRVDKGDEFWYKPMNVADRQPSPPKSTFPLKYETIAHRAINSIDEACSWQKMASQAHPVVDLRFDKAGAFAVLKSLEKPGCYLFSCLIPLRWGIGSLK